ncbi:hypothetical protein ACWDRB_67200 [Nonomuraea sp. NPDC003707]
MDWRWWQLLAGLLVARPWLARVTVGLAVISAATVATLAAGPAVAAAVAVLFVVNLAGWWRPLWPEDDAPYYRTFPRRRLLLLRAAFAAAGPVLTGVAVWAPLFGLVLGLISAGVMAAASLLPIALSRAGLHLMREDGR